MIIDKFIYESCLLTAYMSDADDMQSAVMQVSDAITESQADTISCLLKTVKTNFPLFSNLKMLPASEAMRP